MRTDLMRVVVQVPDPDVPLWTRITIGIAYWILMVALLRGWLFGRLRLQRATPASRSQLSGHRAEGSHDRFA